MHTMLLMVRVVGSYLGCKLLRSMIACRLWLTRCTGLAVEREYAHLAAFRPLWRHAVELDGMYRLHIDFAYDGVFEVFWRHHSGEETPAEVFPSLWQAVVAMAPQIDRYRTVTEASECSVV
jgi:hypothetical protein